MATTPPGIPTDIAAIAGPLYLAYLFQWGLFGALSVQLYNYYLAFPRDRPALKTLVYAVYLLELVQTLIVARDGFAIYAAGFGNMDALNDIQTVWFSGPLLIGIVSCVVQLYYGYRVFILSKSKVLFGVIGALSLLQFSAAIAQAVISKRIGNLHDLATDSPVPSGVWLAGTAVCDLVITGSMVYLLLFHTKSSNRLSATHTIIARIVLLTVETGVLTATAASLDLILLYAFPEQSYHAGVTFTLGKLYSNSLIVLLNNRAHLQRGGVHTLSLRMSALDSSARSGSVSNTSAAVAVGGIRVEQMTFVTADSGDVDERSVEKPTRLSEVEA